MNTDFLKAINGEKHKARLIAACAKKCDIKSDEDTLAICVSNCLDSMLGVKTAVRSSSKSEQIDNIPKN